MSHDTHHFNRLRLSVHHCRKWMGVWIARSLRQTSWRAFRRKRSLQKQWLYRLGRIRLWQQIGLFFVFGIVTPLLFIQAWLFHIHDKALQKEFRDLSAQTAVSIFRDFSSILRNEQLLLSETYRRANRLVPTQRLPYRPLKGYGILGTTSLTPTHKGTPEPPTDDYEALAFIKTAEPFTGFVQWRTLSPQDTKTVKDKPLESLAHRLATDATQVRDTQTAPFVSLLHPAFLAQSLQACTVPQSRHVTWQLLPSRLLYPLETLEVTVPLPEFLNHLPDTTDFSTLHPTQKRQIVDTFKRLEKEPMFQSWQALNPRLTQTPFEQLKAWTHTLNQLTMAQVQTPYLLVRYQRGIHKECRITWKPFRFFQPSGVLGTVFRSNIMVFNETGVFMADGTQRHWEGYQLAKQDLLHFLQALPGVPEVMSMQVHGMISRGQTRENVPSFFSGFSFEPETSTPTATLNDAVLLKLAGDDPWGLLILSPFEISEQYWKRAQRQSTLIFLGQILLAGVLVGVYLYSLIRNFQQLIRGIKGVSRGHYNRRVFLMVHPLTPFEIRYLSREFNRMAYRLSLSWQQTRVTLDQLRQMDRFRSDLIDMVSHELRTPLMVLRGCMGALQRQAKISSPTSGHPIETAQQVTTMKRQLVRLERLVADLLTVPAIEQGKLTLMHEWVNVVELLQICIQDVALRHALVAEEAFTVTFDTPEHHLPLLWSDPERLEQIFVNLLDNACKYRDPSEPIRLTFQLQSTETTSALSLSISNLTRTLKPEMAPLLGEKFQRAVVDNQRNHLTGSGLGLYICQGLMHLLEGTLERRIEACPPSSSVFSPEPQGSQNPEKTYRFVTLLTFPLPVMESSEAMS